MAMPQPVAWSEPLHIGAGRSGAGPGRLVAAPGCRAAPRRSQALCLRAIGRAGWSAPGCFLNGQRRWNRQIWRRRLGAQRVGRPTCWEYRAAQSDQRSLRGHKRRAGALPGGQHTVDHAVLPRCWIALPLGSWVSALEAAALEAAGLAAACASKKRSTARTASIGVRSAVRAALPLCRIYFSGPFWACPGRALCQSPLRTRGFGDAVPAARVRPRRQTWRKPSRSPLR